jgi:hypothetical protein
MSGLTQDADPKSKVEEALLDVSERLSEVHEDLTESLQAVCDKVNLLEQRCAN